MDVNTLSQAKEFSDAWMKERPGAARSALRHAAEGQRMRASSFAMINHEDAAKQATEVANWLEAQADSL